MTEGGLPDGTCVHGVNGSQNQLPNAVPKISSSPVAMKIAANSGHRGERSTNHAKTGRQSAPWRSTRPGISGSKIKPATTHTLELATSKRATRRPYFVTPGV